MVEWIENVIRELGYPGIVLLMFLENLFPPIPSELIMPLAGFTASRSDSLSFAGVILAGTLGAVLGTSPLYALGYIYGEWGVKRLVAIYGPWLGIEERDVDKVNRWFRQRGAVMVFVARLIPGVRSLISLPAGMARMNLLLYFFYTTLGSALWVSFLVYVGNLLGENYDQVERYLDPLSILVLVGLVLWAIYWVWGRRQAVLRQRRAHHQAAKGGPPEEEHHYD